jgi:succinylglutamate desuccinylase
MKLNLFESAPAGFLDLPPNELFKVLPGPSLIRFQGEEDTPLFLATLLHGNEPTGIQAIQKLIKKYQAEGKLLPRRLDVFVGNVEAAKSSERRFPKQPDFNRVWDGGNLPEHGLAREVLAFVNKSGAFASIDIHNTSGKNPHYSCVNRLDAPFVNLAHLFSQTLVYFTRPKEVLSNAMAGFCPSITIEAGQPGDSYGVQHVYEFLEKCLRMKQIPPNWNGKEDLYVYHTIARIRVPKNSRIGFDRNAGDKDFCFIDDLDQQNFSEIPANTLIGWRYNPQMKLSVIDEEDEEVESRFIEYKDTEIRLKRAVVPSMFSTNERIVHQDCLGYLMERFALPTNSDS